MERNVVAASADAAAPTTTTTSTSLTKQCKFCCEEEMGNDPLIVSCNCKGGTLQWLHVSCLNQWRTNNDHVFAFPKCNECKTTYSPIWHNYSPKAPAVTFAPMTSGSSSCTTGTAVGSPVPSMRRCNDRPPTPGIFGSHVAPLLEASESIGEGEELESRSGSPSSVLTQAPCAQTSSKWASVVSYDASNEGGEASKSSSGSLLSTSLAGSTPQAANDKTSKKVRFSVGPSHDGIWASQSSSDPSGASPSGSTPPAYGNTTKSVSFNVTSSPIPGPSPGNGLTTGLFGSNPTAASMFSTNDSCVGSASAPTNFGIIGSSSPPNSGLFGTQPAPTNGGIFGLASPGRGLFGTQPAPTNGGVFGSSPAGSGLFGIQPAPNSNGNGAAHSRSAPFPAGARSAHACGATSESIAHNSSGPFGATPVAGGLFGDASKKSPAPTFGNGAPTASLFGSPVAHSSASATGATQATPFGSPVAHSSASATGTTQARDYGSRAGGFLFNAGSAGVATTSHSAPGPGFNLGGRFSSSPNQAAPAAAASSTQFLFGSPCAPNNSAPAATCSVRTNTYYFGNHGVSVPVSVSDTVPSGGFGNHGHFANAQSSVPFGGFGGNQLPAITVRPGMPTDYSLSLNFIIASYSLTFWT